MRILLLILIMMAIFAITAKASVVRRNVDEFGDDEDSAENDIEEDDNGDDGDDDDGDPEDLPIASIKSRAIAMDRELCRELSRYRPHHPRCQLYCEKLNHWMGMCRRDSCHCYS